MKSPLTHPLQNFEISSKAEKFYAGILFRIFEAEARPLRQSASTWNINRRILLTNKSFAKQLAFHSTYENVRTRPTKFQLSHRGLAQYGHLQIHNAYGEGRPMLIFTLARRPVSRLPRHIIGRRPGGLITYCARNRPREQSITKIVAKNIRLRNEGLKKALRRSVHNGVYPRNEEGHPSFLVSTSLNL